LERLHSGSLNRQQRKELERRFNAAEPDLEMVHPHAAGIDIGNASHFVAVSPSRDSQPVQEFGSWTADLKRMARWLQQCGITTVAMQSTGVYWIAVYEVLEKEGLEVYSAFRLSSSGPTTTSACSPGPCRCPRATTAPLSTEMRKHGLRCQIV